MTFQMFDSCCFCLPLKLGTLLFGYFLAISHLIGILASTVIILSGFIIVLKDTESEDGRNGTAVGVTFIVAGTILLVLFVVKMIFVILLIIGGHKGNTTFIKAFLNFSIVMLIITVLLNFVNMNTRPSLMTAHMVAYALEIYALLVIHSHMVKLQEGEKQADELPIKTPMKIEIIKV